MCTVCVIVLRHEKFGRDRIMWKTNETEKLKNWSFFKIVHNWFSAILRMRFSYLYFVRATLCFFLIFWVSNISVFCGTIGLAQLTIESIVRCQKKKVCSLRTKDEKTFFAFDFSLFDISEIQFSFFLNRFSN
jgi:hypothetical protein